MTVFNVELDEGIVALLKRMSPPVAGLDLPSVPVAGDTLRIESLRGRQVAETVECQILKVERVGQLRTLVKLTLKFDTAASQNHQTERQRSHT